MFTVAALSLLLLGSAHALNDWRTSCTDGSCSWDLDDSTNRGKGTATGTLQIVRKMFVITPTLLTLRFELKEWGC